MRKFRAVVEVGIELEINDENVIDRVVNNENGWREALYDFSTAEQVVTMLAHNYVVNGISDVRRLDGWGDVLSEDAVVYTERWMGVHDVEELTD